MEKVQFTKGLILKDVIQYDDHSLIYHHAKLQFPLSIVPFKFRGFVTYEDSEFVYDANIHYYMNVGKLFKRKTLYLSQSSKYDKLPTTEEELARDDQDDFTFMELEENTKEGLEPSGKLVETGKVKSSKKEEDVDYDADLYLKTDTIQLRLGRNHTSAIYEHLKQSPSIELHTAKVGKFFSFNQQLLAYDDDWAFHVVPHFFSDSEIDSTPINYMAFFVEKKPFLFGSNGLYCGYHRQINIKGISRSVLSEFGDWCRERAPRLTNEGDTYTSSIIANPFNLWRWIHPDEITITNEALVYTRKTLRRDEMVYLPFKRTSLFLSTGGLFTKKFEVYGEQNILPKFSFSRSDVSSLKNALEKHRVRCGSGRSWHSSYIFPKNWFGRAPRLLNVDKKLIYYPKRIESKMKKHFGMKTRVCVLDSVEIKEVIWHKSIFNLWGTIEIKGSSKNIREDQNSEQITILIPNLLMFSYKYFLFFSGSLRDFLKKSSANFNRKYSKYQIN
jgi:hypothetical protein